MHKIERITTILSLAVAFCAMPLLAEVCPDTISQGGINKSGSTYTLHDSGDGTPGSGRPENCKAYIITQTFLNAIPAS